ncbi:unnamed protein product [Polarella glacialis]|uniref:Uncharacterized protein n=1 Tax=Polarella glacialis TaxID=89957 RepID=A0A813E314_POLGL|nr:unnamed protein product [Polarella glacialis]
MAPDPVLSIHDLMWCGCPSSLPAAASTWLALLFTAHLWSEHKQLSLGGTAKLWRCLLQWPNSPEECRMFLKTFTLLALSIWTIVVSIISLLYITFVDTVVAENTDRGVYLKFHLFLYTVCVALKVALKLWPAASSSILNGFIQVLHFTVLVRQISIPPQAVLIFAVGSKVLRVWLCISTSDYRAATFWNCLIGLAAIYKNVTFLGMFMRCEQLSEPWFHRSLVAMAALEVAVSFLFSVLSAAVEILFLKLGDAIMGEQASTDKMSAVRRMLTVFCDAQAYINSSLELIGQQDMFANFLKVRCGKTLEGIEFISLLCEPDRQRFRDFTRNGASASCGILPTALPCGSLHVQMSDSTGALLDVELYHVCIPERNGGLGHLIGIREQSREVTARVTAAELVDTTHDQVHTEETEMPLIVASQVPATAIPSDKESNIPRDPVFGTLLSARLPHFDEQVVPGTSSCSQSSEASSTSSAGATAALKGIKNVDVSIDAFSPDLRIKSALIRFCDLNVGASTPSIPTMKDLLSPADFSRLSDWIQDEINSAGTAGCKSERLSPMVLNAGFGKCIISDKHELFTLCFAGQQEESSCRVGASGSSAAPGAKLQAFDIEQDQKNQEQDKDEIKGGQQEGADKSKEDYSPKQQEEEEDDEAVQIVEQDEDDEEEEEDSEEEVDEDHQINSVLRLSVFSVFKIPKMRRRRLRGTQKESRTPAVGSLATIREFFPVR